MNLPTRCILLLSLVNAFHSIIMEQNEFYFDLLMNNQYDPGFSHELNDIDPDENVLSLFPIRNSNYYNEDEFNTLVRNQYSVSHDLSLFHLNVRSLPHNFDQLSQYLNTLNLNFSIVGLSETWHTEHTVNSYELPGYTSVHKYRCHQRGGGVSLYVSSSLQYRERHDLSSCISVPCECLFVEIVNVDDKKCIVGIVYRPPNANVSIFNNEVSLLMSKFNNSNSYCYIMGDFNINLLNYASHPPTNEFVDLLFAHSFLPLISKPTRIDGNSETLIDNIFSNHLINNDKLMPGLLVTDISDHYPIFCLIPKLAQSTTPANRTSFHRPFTAAGQETFVSTINEMDWHDVLNNVDTQLAFTVFHNKLTNAYNIAFPLKKISAKRAAKPWISDTLLKCIKRKNQLYVQYKQNKTAFNERRYKSYKYALQKILRNEEKSHYCHLVDQNKHCIKKTWDVIRGLIGKKINISTSEFLINDSKVSNPSVIANEFNDYFVNVGPNLASRISTVVEDNTIHPPVNSHTMYLSDITQTELINVINDLKNSGAGSDCIKPAGLKLIANSISLPLVHLFNLSFQQCIVPDQLKIARVVPIFKKGNSQLIENYRPISILSSLSKVLERLVYNRIIAFLENHNILSTCQYGFRKKYSTYMPLIHLLDKIHTALDNGDCVLGLFLDLSKAFDTVNHNILLQKIYRYGLRGHIYNWIQNYLSNRVQFVDFDGINSCTRSIVCGVPQGSILGPLLFLIYINDLPLQSNLLNTVMFADDSNLFLQGPNVEHIERIFNSELKKIVHWFNVNKLSLNVGKTHCMLFNRRRNLPSNPSIVINNVEIDFVLETKFLGVILRNNLSWDSHINHICNKISKSTGILKKVKFKICKKTLLSLYNSFIFPYLHYCNIIWGNAPQYQLSKILKVQKRAVRIILNKGYRDHSRPLFDELNVLTIDEISIYCKCLFMFQFMTHRLPHIFDDLFLYRTNVHSHVTRNANSFHLPLCRTETTREFITYSGPFLFNQILKHPGFTDIQSFGFAKFKKSLKKLVRSGYFVKL